MQNHFFRDVFTAVVVVVVIRGRYVRSLVLSQYCARVRVQIEEARANHCKPDSR